ncbi:MAG: glycerate kinase [Sphingomonas sp.]|uniref:glycerate kinase type-2 family protein n=1 Tax=Sphingomonas sp. TaxID=28214 RepID=UPI001AC3F391|nr:glycerate kinase [Sphingomonas sp.]MBN8815244.1 glycerate kinase [Sphingomonas sp.]
MSEGQFDEQRQAMRSLFDRAVSAVSAETVMPASLPRSDGGRVAFVAIGKAAAAMMRVAIDRAGPPDAGLVVTRHGHLLHHQFPAVVEVIEAGHPVPDSQSVRAAERALQLADQLGAADRLVLLLSGGGSALAAAPVAGVTLADKQAVTRALLRSGATIGEINTLRKRLSRIKGGRLAIAAGPARTTTYIISDVPGDDPAFVASGPTVADAGGLAEARAIVSGYGIDVPPSVAAALADPANETPSPDALGLAGCQTEIVANARDALAAACELAEQEGFAVTNLGDRLQAEARHLGASHAALARRLAADSSRRAIISGGETTVTVVNPHGRGGRNLEYLLGMAIALGGDRRISALACDTDGIDGTEDAAGAMILPDTLSRAAALGLDPLDHLARNDAYAFFAALGDLVVTGPTLTNVNDFRVILVEPAAGKPS